MTADSRFLEGPFAPVFEELAVFDLLVTGRVPVELNGRYMRNGPNPLGVNDPDYHWFTGPGMVHGVRLREGRAEWYRNRWVRSRLLAESLGETWPAGPIHGTSDFAANTHVIGHAGRILATVEGGPLPYELTGDLGTIGPCDFGGTLTGGYAAHTKLDHSTGELHAVAHFWAWDHAQHVVVDSGGKVCRTTDIAVADGPMMHDFALTSRYVVLLDLPVTFSLDAVAAGQRMPYRWNPAHPARVGLLSRDDRSADVIWIDIEPCFVFHTLNAYDDGGRVVLDLCRYDRGYDVSSISASGSLTLDRWIIDPTDRKLTTQRLDDRPQEFPRIDDRLLGRSHRYGYTAMVGGSIVATVSSEGAGAGHGLENALIKHDLSSATAEVRDFGPEATTGEVVFVPAAADADEDDGYVMGFVHNPDRGAADLIILAARDFTGGPVARVHLPARIPLGFHGNWIADT